MPSRGDPADELELNFEPSDDDVTIYELFEYREDDPMNTVRASIAVALAAALASGCAGDQQMVPTGPPAGDEGDMAGPPRDLTGTPEDSSTSVGDGSMTAPVIVIN